EGIFALQGCNGLHSMSAADGPGACFGKTKVLNLASEDEVFDGSRSLFGGSIFVDAMLVKQVDGIGFETLERAFDDLLDMIGAAIGCGPLAVIVGIGFKAELGSD